jgi:hypothetical protein
MGDEDASVRLSKRQRCTQKSHTIATITQAETKKYIGGHRYRIRQNRRVVCAIINCIFTTRISTNNSRPYHSTHLIKDPTDDDKRWLTLSYWSQDDASVLCCECSLSIEGVVAAGTERNRAENQVHKDIGVRVWWKGGKKKDKVV